MKKAEMIGLNEHIVINKIYVIRGQKVMLDRDLAELYQVETRILNQQVKRNIKRFPDDFMFQLSKEEFENLISQNVTSSWGGVRKAPLAFTEQGLAMLSGVLNSDRAIFVNIQIMRVFTKIRQMFIDNTEIRLSIERLERKTENNTKNIELVFQYIDELADKKESRQSETKPRTKIGYKISKK